MTDKEKKKRLVVNALLPNTYQEVSPVWKRAVRGLDKLSGPELDALWAVILNIRT
jgi:hypothetical protein